MEQIEYDFYKTKNMIMISRLMDKDYDKLYSRTNEDLKKLFECFSVRDKKVLTVLASSDQFFSCHYLGAKSVDTFDSNKLTEYYYYLRTWLLNYKDCFSISNNKFSSVTLDKIIKEILNLVACENLEEKKAFNYWQMCVKDNICGNLFHEYTSSYSTVVEDIEKLKLIMKDKKLNFKHQNIFDEILKDHKYNTIILSNILEYIPNDKKVIEKCRDNLFDILEDGGEVICTNLLDAIPKFIVRDIFQELFLYEAFSIKNPYSGGEIGYCYRKK